jgi:hypothetical protein
MWALRINGHLEQIEAYFVTVDITTPVHLNATVLHAAEKCSQQDTAH